MAEETLPTRVGQNAPLAPLPTYMQADKGVGLEKLSQFVVPPMVKIVTATSDKELRETFGVGTVIMSPDNVVIASPSDRDPVTGVAATPASFLFTPLFFYEEFITWVDRDCPDVFMIKDKSFNPLSAIARKARSSDTWTEPMPAPNEKFNYSHQQHLNFVIKVEGIDKPMVISFSRSSWKVGKELARMIHRREAAIFGNRFACLIVETTDDKNTWLIPQVESPPDGVTWVSEADYPVFKELHEKFMKLHAESLLRPDYTVVNDLEPVIPERNDM